MSKKIKECPKNYIFLTKSGTEISEDQEDDILAYDQTFSESFSHHTFQTTVQRDHLFIRIIRNCDEENKNLKKRKRDEDHDHDHDDPDKKRKLLIDLFQSAPVELQQQLAMKTFEKTNYNVRGYEGNNTSLALIEAQRNNLTGLSYLLVEGANINFRDINGNTLLHHLCLQNNEAGVSILLSTMMLKTSFLCGSINILSKNNEGKYPQDLTNNTKIRDLINLFRNRIFKISLPSIYECTLKNLRLMISDICHDETLSSNIVFYIQGTKVHKYQENDFIVSKKVGDCEIWIDPLTVQTPTDELAKKLSSAFNVSKPTFVKKTAVETIPIHQRQIKFSLQTRDVIPQAAKNPSK